MDSPVYNTGDLVRFEDDFTLYYPGEPTIRWGVCGIRINDRSMNVYRIVMHNPPYGLKATASIRVPIIKIKKNFGKVEYNEFIRTHPEWTI